VQIIGRPQLSLVAADVTPNDPRFGEQWHYGYTAGTFEGLNLLPAWDITTGSPSVVIAVIDTGILNHADLSGRFLAGYDFITDVQAANDGDGRDPDPSDPGDWVTLNECPERPAPRNSSWHGTHVAGTIGASTNNSLGVAGVNWISKILPVRVLGKCGGITSDLVDAMRWSAGLTVAGVPTNTVPAQVLNLSLTGSGDCSVSEQDAIDDIVNAGATVVVAAGNSNLDAAGYSPGNCDNVINVAANDRPGDKAAYSNFGDKIEVTAPGNFVLSTWNSGLTTPDADAYAYFQGTSMAAPHVAGLVSLIKGLRPDFWPAQILTRLESTARPFPPGSSCLSQGCGSGIVDAFLALDSLDILTEQFYMPVAIYSGQQPAK
jgi:serine protease